MTDCLIVDSNRQRHLIDCLARRPAHFSVCTATEIADLPGLIGRRMKARDRYEANSADMEDSPRRTMLVRQRARVHAWSETSEGQMKLIITSERGHARIPLGKRTYRLAIVR